MNLKELLEMHLFVAHSAIPVTTKDIACVAIGSPDGFLHFPNVLINDVDELEIAAVNSSFVIMINNLQQLNYGDSEFIFIRNYGEQRATFDALCAQGVVLRAATNRNDNSYQN